MPKKNFTDATIKNLKAADGARVDYFDIVLPGFGARVSGPVPGRKECHRAWFLFYRIGPKGDRKQKRLTLGEYPKITLADARARAILAQQQIEKGEDPAAVAVVLNADAAPEIDTVAKVADLFMSRHRHTQKGRPLAPRYIEERARTFRLHVLPVWGDRGIRTITRRDVNKLLDDIVDAGTPVAANRTLAAISAMFNWAIGREYIDASPVVKIAKPGAETPCERVLDDDELKRVWSASAESGYPFGPYVQLLLATGQRRSEVADMRWDDVDLKARVWTMMKNKAGRVHLVPLSKLAVDIIAAIPRTITGTYVFSTRSNRPISGFSKMKAALDQKVGDPALNPWTIHDARRSAATGMARLKVTRFAIGRVLNHADPSITGIYDRHDYFDEKRAALDTWGAHLLELVDPPPAADEPAPSNVVQMTRVDDIARGHEMKYKGAT
jgi:integrase